MLGYVATMLQLVAFLCATIFVSISGNCHICLGWNSREESRLVGQNYYSIPEAEVIEASQIGVPDANTIHSPA